MSWTPAEAGTSYTVYYSVTASGPGGIQFPTGSATGTSPLTVTGLTNSSPYTIVVRATNSAGSTDSSYAFVTPRVTGLTFTQYCPSGPASCFDEHRGDSAYGGYYKSIAYTRYGGQDHYVAVKSNRQIMRVVDDGPPTHVTDPFGGVNLTSLNSIAGGDNGNLFAVGDTGLVARSQDGGLNWSSAYLGFTGAIAANITYKSVTYGGGKFVAVGTYYDSFANTRDIIVTFDPNFSAGVGQSCSSFCGISAVTPGNSSGLTQVAYGNGRFVALGSNNYYYDAATYTYQPNITASYTSTDAAAWTFNTPTPSNSFSGYADKLFYFSGLFWGLQGYGDTGGFRSSNGVNWSGNDWQVTNPGNFINDMVVGVNQIVAVDAGGYTYVNKTGGASQYTAWTGSNPYSQLYRVSGNERNLLAYGNGRYVAISLGSVFFSK